MTVMLNKELEQKVEEDTK